jgi:hypothetical protein
MGDQSRRATRGSGRPGRSRWPSDAAAVSTAAGSPTGRTSRPTTRRRSITNRSFLTGPTYQRLVLGGLTPTEAANLTAFLCGLPLAPTAWRLSEVNRLLFLRELHRAGRFGGQARPT